MKPLSLRSGHTTPTSTPIAPKETARPVASTGSTTTPTTTTSPTAAKRHEQVPPSLPPTATIVAKQAGQGGVPSWATPGFFTALGNGGDEKKSLQGGSGLNVRLGAMTARPTTTTTTAAAKDTTTDVDTRRERGRGLLSRALHGAGVMAGRPMTAQEIADAPVALHLTKPDAVSSILRTGLRPTTGLYKNLTTWFRDAVYMFGREPTAYQKFVNFSTAAGQATATIEIDLKKLDPDKLYKRVLDGAVIYVSNEPIPKEALRLRPGGP